MKLMEQFTFYVDLKFIFYNKNYSRDQNIIKGMIVRAGVTSNFVFLCIDIIINNYIKL
jgi:hypothetical protein